MHLIAESLILLPAPIRNLLALLFLQSIAEIGCIAKGGCILGGDAYFAVKCSCVGINRVQTVDRNRRALMEVSSQGEGVLSNAVCGLFDLIVAMEM